MKINLQLLRIYLAKIYPRYNLASIIKFLVHRLDLLHSKGPNESQNHKEFGRTANLGEEVPSSVSLLQ